jgi:hypothetical protein
LIDAANADFKVEINLWFSLTERNWRTAAAGAIALLLGVIIRWLLLGGKQSFVLEF